MKNSTLMQLFALLFCVSIQQIKGQDLEWVKPFSGNLNQEAIDVSVDSQGNVYTVGWFDGTVDFDPGTAVFNLAASGNRDVFISKLDSSGNFLWAKKCGAFGYDQPYSVFIDEMDNVLVTGYFDSTVDFDPGDGVFNLTSSGIYDAFVLKLNADGNFLWAKRFGGSSVDIGYSIYSNAQGVYVTGRFQGACNFNPDGGDFIMTATGLIDIFTLKLTVSGDFLWAKQFGTTGANIGEAIAVDEFDNSYTLARFKETVDFDPSGAVYNLTSFGSDDAVIVKLDADGNFIWAKQMGGTSTEEPAELVLDDDGNIYTTGYFSGTADFDPGSGTGYLTSQGSFDVFATKWDADGDFIWAKSLGGSGNNDGKGLAVDTSGNVYLSGIFTNTLDADPSSGTFPLTSYGGNDIYAVKLNSNGDFVWATYFGGTGVDLGRAIAVDNSSSAVYVAGAFESVADFDSTTGDVLLTSAGIKDAFMAKLYESSLSVPEENVLSFEIYPNPVKSELYIDSDLDINTIAVYNSLGRLIKTWNVEKRNNLLSFNMDFLNEGVYFLNVISGERNETRKFVKQN